MFKEQIKVYKHIEHDIATYHRAKPGDPERSYNFLMSSAKSYLQRQREDKNRKAVQDKLSAKEQLALPAPPSDPGDKDRRKSNKGKGNSRGRSKSPGGGKGNNGKGDRSNSRGRSPKGKGKGRGRSPSKGKGKGTGGCFSF